MIPAFVFNALCFTSTFFVTTTNTVLTTTDGRLGKPGESVLLLCETDPPGATVRFWRGEEELKNSTGRYLLDQFNASLTIYNVGESDVGAYRCTTELNEEAIVYLLSKPVIRELEKLPGLTEGETLHLTCRTWGWPTPSCTWLRKDKFLGPSDPGVSFDDLRTATNVTIKNAQLTILHMNRSDQTDYTCSATDGQSSTNATVYVRVKDRLAAVWPLIGIVILVTLTIIIIIFAERKRRRDEAKLHPQ